MRHPKRGVVLQIAGENHEIVMPRDRCDREIGERSRMPLTACSVRQRACYPGRSKINCQESWAIEMGQRVEPFPEACDLPGCSFAARFAIPSSISAIVTTDT